MKHLVASFLIFFGLLTQVQAQTPPIVERFFSDDSYVHVPLQFGFPFYGRTFTNSWMHSNGVVSFLDPAAPIQGVGWNPAAGAYCCEGIPPTTNTPQFSYMIAPLWTDLYPVGQSRFRTQGDSTFQRYHWENIAEISNMGNLNTFGLEIRPDGFIGSYYTSVNIQNQNTWIGTIGDPRLGEWDQIYYGRGIVPGTRSNWEMNETLPGDQCLVNPLSSSTCAGYTQAMCSSNPLYSTTCPGYQQAYFSQQCSINVFYNTSCPGYAAAYLSQQCSNNTLYSPSCPGYQQAYFNQQCSLNSLYNEQCPGYETAYFNQQCSADPMYNSQCAGYADAYYVQQCNANPLYDSGCNGYDAAYLSQQCSLDALYSNKCDGYAEAYAKKNILTTETQSPQEQVKTAVVAEVEVSKVIEEPNQSPATVSPADVTAAVQLVAVAPAPTAKGEPSNATSSNTPQSATTTSSTSSSEKKDAPKNTRQQLAQRRLEAARAKAVEQAPKMASQMESATTMEQQVETQAVVLSAMGFVPGFDAYGKAFIPDGVGYKPFTIYNNQKNVDNANMMRGLSLASDRLHNALVDSQYNKN